MIVIIFSFYDIYIYYKFILRILEMIIIHYNNIY